MCENEMNPGVPLRSKRNLKPHPENNTLVPLKGFSSKYLMNTLITFTWEYPPATIPGMMIQTYLIELTYGESYFN